MLFYYTSLHSIYKRKNIYQLINLSIQSVIVPTTVGHLACSLAVIQCLLSVTYQGLGEQPPDSPAGNQIQDFWPVEKEPHAV